MPWLGHIRVAYLVYKQLSICSPERLFHLIFPPAKNEGPSFSTFLSLATSVNSFKQTMYWAAPVCQDCSRCWVYSNKQDIQFVLPKRSRHANRYRQAIHKSTNWLWYVLRRKWTGWCDKETVWGSKGWQTGTQHSDYQARWHGLKSWLHRFLAMWNKWHDLPVPQFPHM